MTKLEEALTEAEALPEDVREKLGDDLLHAVHRLIALRRDLDDATVELAAGKGIEWGTALTDLKSRYDA